MEILRTERLLLRELTLADTGDLCEIMQDPQAMTAYERTYDTPQVEEWIRRNMARYRQDGAGLWAVVRRQDGVLLGQCGLVYQQVEGLAFWEVGYLFKRRFWHQGYATEAARACRDYAFSTLGAPAVYSIVKHNNLPSQRVAQRNGMHIHRTVHYGSRLADTLHYLYMVENPAQ